LSSRESSSDTFGLAIITSLKDETRLKIFIYLTVYQKLTLKQLSEILNKGKTTIHHHIRKLEEKAIIKWEEEESEKKKLKTRYYSINYKKLQLNLKQKN
jgi:DNA-binding transcriptional ArsR family regulator